MKIRPRYGTDPLIAYEGDPAAVAAPAVRQRLRLARTLAGFGPQQWEAPSRCAAWTNRDVVVHLTSANRFWVHSIGQARRGTPSQVLAAFDPVATPAGLVAAAVRAVRVTAVLAPAVPVAVRDRAVDVLEGLSLRAPLHLEPGWQWLAAGLARAFEARPSEPRVQPSPHQGTPASGITSTSRRGQR